MWHQRTDLRFVADMWHQRTRWCHMSVLMASASQTNAWSDSDTATESDDGLTSLSVINETDSPMCLSIPFFLDKLLAPTKSELARKQRVTFDPPHDVKHYKHPRCVSDPKLITAEMCVKSYRNECFVVSADKFFCTACREELFVKASVLMLPVKCAKHNQGKIHLQLKEKHEHDIGPQLKHTMVKATRREKRSV